ncbi:uncharacterized protein NPIL_495871, partial [Nephila pilipes]
METSTTMDTNAPSGESLESFLESVRVDALRANLSSIQNSSDYLSIAIFAENKLNCLSNFMFPDINVSNNISVDLIKIIEEARLKFSILKHQEMKDDLNQFTNLCQSWGIQNPDTQTPFVLAKPRQRKNSLPGETSKKQKLEATTCQNKFSVLYIEDPPEELQIDEPLPPSPTPEKTTTKPKKKHGPSKKPAPLANKQPPAPTPVITAAQIAQPRGIKTLTEENKLPLLSNYVTSNVYQFINDCTTYTGAIAILDSLFIKKRNVIFARHCLSTRNQQTEETVNEYLQVLNQLSKDCDFTDVKAEEYRKEYIRDAFIRGLKCPRIRQRLLENTSMTLDQAFEQARTLESAEVHAASYMGNSFPVQSAAMKTDDFSEETLATSAASSSSRSQKCFFCGNDLHSRTICPARDVFCRKCGKKGHYQRVCKSRP